MENNTEIKVLEELRESKERYKFLANQFEAILDHMPGFVFYKDKNNCFVTVNQYMADAYGMSKVDMEGKCLEEFKEEETARKCFQDDLEVINSGEPKLNIEEKWKTDKGIRFMNTSKIPFVDKDGEIIGIIGMSFDITEKEESEKKLKILQQTVEQAPDAIVITEPDGAICFVNKSFLEVTGYEMEEVMGKNPRLLKLNRDSNVDYEDLWSTVMAGGEWHGVFHNKRKNGEEYWERASIAPLLDKDGAIIKIIGIKEDVTKEHENQIELERIYRIDMLTNIPNRRSFLEMAENEFFRNKRYPEDAAFLMLDIDYFKRINDQHGHCAGDMALTEFAAVCASTIRTTDLIGRLGGEEFGIYLINSGYEEASLIAERLRRNVEKIEVVCDDGTHVHLTVSIGITKPLESDKRLDEIIKRADLALYQAKKNGRNLVEWI